MAYFQPPSTNSTTTWPILTTAATGRARPATDSALTYNASTNVLTAGSFSGNLTGNADTVTTINGKISAGDNVTLTGLGTTASPYVISAAGGSSGGLQESDFNINYSTLVQQSGTGSPSVVALSTNTILGRLSGDIVSLTPTQIKTLLSLSISDITSLQSTLDGKESAISSGTSAQYWRGDKSWQTLNKAAVGLPNVDNTSDLDKPVSTATQTALDAKLDDTQFSGLTKITVSSSAPSSPSVGDLWIDTN